ncbi:hypothetical protein VTN02DRAFT_236 [Thermoascus thermophilus]
MKFERTSLALLLLGSAIPSALGAALSPGDLQKRDDKEHHHHHQVDGCRVSGGRGEYEVVVHKTVIISPVYINTYVEQNTIITVSNNVFVTVSNAPTNVVINTWATSTATRTVTVVSATPTPRPPGPPGPPAPPEPQGPRGPQGPAEPPSPAPPGGWHYKGCGKHNFRKTIPADSAASCATICDEGISFYGWSRKGRCGCGGGDDDDGLVAVLTGDYDYVDHDRCGDDNDDDEEDYYSIFSKID